MGIFSLSRSGTVIWLDCSELALLVFGLILVAGLIGEFRLDHHPPKGLNPPSKRRKHFKRFFEILVILGVAGELLADGGIFGFGSHLEEISDSEIKQLRTENSDLLTKLAVTERTEQTNSIAVAQLNVLNSSNELEAAKIEEKIASLDPTNDPLETLAGEIRIRFNNVKLDGAVNCSVFLTLSSSVLSQKLLLVANEAYLVNGTTYSIPLSTSFRPQGNMLMTSMLLPGVTAFEASQQFDQCTLEITNFPVADAVVQRANIRVNFNIFPKRFALTNLKFQNGAVMSANFQQ